ncbi:efflux RND transporter permease subunit [Vibrio cidicii]
MNWLTKWLIHHPVGANLLMYAILISGLLAYGQLRVESFPQIAPSSIAISVSYPGGSAQQIDDGVTQRIEEAISGIAGIKQVTSQSVAGMANVIVRKTSSADLNQLLDDVRNRVNAISTLPTLAEKPQVTRNEFTNLAAFVVISGPRSDDALQPIARQVEQALKRHPDISSVANWGRRKPQLVIEPDPARLHALGLSLEDLATTIERMSLQTRSGELVSERGRVLLRGDWIADDLQKLSRLTIVSRTEGRVTLGDIAKLNRGYEASGAIVRNNGENAIALLVSTSQTDNLLDVSAAIAETLAAQRKSLPADIQLSTIADMAPYIEDQLQRLGNNAWQGLLIVIVVLGLFLDLRLAFWVAAGIPVALAGTLTAMRIADYSLNDITLFGFILVLGILVDDAVVVGEAIYDKRSKQLNARKAAWQGVHSVSVATVFGVLTTMAAFSPMLWINSDLARLLAGFSAVVIFALFFSLLESKFILPSHLAQLSATKKSQGRFAKLQRAVQQRLNWFIARVYLPLLKAVLRHKLAALFGFISAVVLAYGMWANGTIRSAIFPDIPGRYLTAKVVLQQGAPLPLQKQAVMQLEHAMTQVEEHLLENGSLATPPVVNLLAWSDGHGEIEVTAQLSREAIGTLPASSLTELWRQATGSIEGVYSQQFSSAETPAGEIFLSISASERELAKQVTRQLAQTLRSLPGVNDVYDDGQDGQPQVRLRLNAYGQQLGVTQEQLARLAGDAFGEREIHRLLEQGQETQVLLRYPSNERKTLAQLEQTRLPLAQGQSVLLADVADFHYQQPPQILYRRDRDPVVNLFWQQNRAIQAPEQTLMQLQDSIAALNQQYPQVKIRAGGELEEIGEVSDGFRSAMLLTLLLIYVLLALPLQSYWQPLLIMAVIPFGFAGAIFGHYLLDLPISLLSLFGMMAMSGIVINDSLVLITYFNREYRAGATLTQALINAGARRFRAIFLTTLTTVCGLLPLLNESAEQAQYLKPAAVSLVFGELFATAVTLLLVPLLLALTHSRPKETTLETTRVESNLNSGESAKNGAI